MTQNIGRLSGPPKKATGSHLTKSTNHHSSMTIYRRPAEQAEDSMRIAAHHLFPSFAIQPA